MRSRICRFPLARIAALAVSLGVIGSLATAAPSFAAAPTAGSTCQSQTGKIAGRGSTLQLWLQFDLMGSYANNVCGGGVPADANANGAAPGAAAATGTEYDITDPGEALDTLPNGETFSSNWMTAYNYPSAQTLGASGANAGIGSGAGETTIGCRAEAFSGTDIPVTSSQLSVIDGALPTPGGTLLSKNCDPTGSGGGLVTPFPPLTQPAGFPDPGDFPNPGDQTTSKGAMLFPIGISAVSIFANLPPACISSSGVSLSTADMENIWGGAYQTWDQLASGDPSSGILSPCNATVTNSTTGAVDGSPLPISRVVRSDNSGTAQSFDNYMADAFGYGTGSTAGICANNTNTSAADWQDLQGNQFTNGTDVNWPEDEPINTVSPIATGNCSTVLDNSGAGGPALILTAETNEGSVGFADYSDTIHDTNDFKSLVPGDSIVQAGLEASTGATDVQPNTAGGASNCTTTETAPTTTTAVGLNGHWDLTAQTSANEGADDIAFAREGATYPICSLTWDFVWTGEDGDSPPAPTASSAEAASSSTVAVSSVAGLPNAGSFTTPTSGNATPTVATNPNAPAGTVYTVPFTEITLSSTAGLANSGTFTVPSSNGDGTQTLSYTGIDGNTLTGVTGGTTGATIASGATATFPLNQTVSYTGISSSSAVCSPEAPPCLTGVTGDTVAIPSGATLTFPEGTGGPEANLSADQRQTEWSYFTYVMSPAAQSSETTSGYTSLPTAWTTVIREAFQSAF